MKILFLTRRFYPEIGGVEKHVFKISEEFISRGHEVEVICEQPPDFNSNKKKNYQSIGESDTHYITSKKPVKSSQTHHFEDQKIKIHRINGGRNDWFKKFRIWKEMLAVLPLLRQADVIHCHDVFYWYLPFRFIFPKKKIYVTFHGYEKYPLSFKNIYSHKLAEKLSSGNICVGKFLEKWYGTKADYIIYGATDLRIKTQDLRPQNRQSALFFGRLDAQTGVLEYKKAVELVKKDYPSFKLAIIGDGKDRKKLEHYIISGFVKDPEAKLANYGFAFVSRYLSILEAMAEKRLVFALYDNPLKHDYLEMTPYADKIVIVGSAVELSEKIKYYLKNPSEEKKLVDSSYAWVKGQTWKSVVDVYSRLWKSA